MLSECKNTFNVILAAFLRASHLTLRAGRYHVACEQAIDAARGGIMATDDRIALGGENE